MTYFLHIAYDGTDYQGWQYQTNVKSVQGMIETALEKVFKKKISVTGCGRTDAGVHASQYILHIEIESLNFDLKFRLNHNLPKDIVVYDVIKVGENNHARLDVTSRTYEYFIHFYEDPYLHRFSSQYLIDNLDFKLMQQAVQLINNCSDFVSFCKQPHLYKNTICHIKKVTLYTSEDKQRIRLSITANRFLRGMIRLIVRYLLKVGTKEMSLEDFGLLINNNLYVADRASALPNGLYLSNIEYPYLSITPQPNICSFLKMGLEKEQTT